MPVTNLKQAPHNLVQLIISGWNQMAADFGISYYFAQSWYILLAEIGLGKDWIIFF
jgi:hypothetical protein